MFTFNGTTKVISVSTGVTAFTTVQLYSEWKLWARDNTEFLQAFRTEGSILTAQYFYMMNGWQIRPQEADHVLTITGNLVHDDGIPLFLQTIGDFQVNIVQKVSASISDPTITQYTDLLNLIRDQATIAAMNTQS